MERKIVRFLLWFVVGVVTIGAVLFILDVRTGRFEHWRAGVSGEIVDVRDVNLLILERGIERTIVVTPATDIRRGRERIEDTPMVGDFVIVFGRQAEGGTFEAAIIQILRTNEFFNRNNVAPPLP